MHLRWPEAANGHATAALGGPDDTRSTVDDDLPCRGPPLTPSSLEWGCSCEASHGWYLLVGGADLPTRRGVAVVAATRADAQWRMQRCSCCAMHGMRVVDVLAAAPSRVSRRLSVNKTETFLADVSPAESKL